MSGQVSRVAREQLEAVFRAGLDGVDPAALIRKRVRLADTDQGRGVLIVGRDDCGPISLGLDDYRRVVVLAAGKGAAPMCRTMQEVLGERLDFGLAVTKYGHGPGAGGESVQALDGAPSDSALSGRITILEAGHPVPDENGVAAARRMLDLAQGLGAEDLAIVLLSGGGSALLPCPAAGLTLAHKQEATRLLLACGADIGEINTVRKHLSSIKGGGLLRALAPAACLTLALSDVMGDDPDAVASSIASGPTAPDPTTFQHALAVLERYHLNGHGVADRMPAPVLEHLRRGAAGERPETLKPDDPILEHAPWVLLGDNATALEAAADHARSLGWEVVLPDRAIRGEAREEAVALAHRVGGLRRERAGRDSAGQGRPVCLLAGGESVVTLRGQGRGGRNQEMALAFLREMCGREMAGDHSLAEVAFLAASTDGTDGPTDAAGAFADSALLRRADVDAASLDAALADNDSHTFFDRRGGLLRTGPTGTNVCDLALVLIS